MNNICDDCIKEHSQHQYIQFSKIGLNNKEKEKFNNLKKEIENNLNIFNKIKGDIENIINKIIKN